MGWDRMRRMARRVWPLRVGIAALLLAASLAAGPATAREPEAFAVRTRVFLIELSLFWSRDEAHEAEIRRRRGRLYDLIVGRDPAEQIVIVPVETANPRFFGLRGEDIPGRDDERLRDRLEAILDKAPSSPEVFGFADLRRIIDDRIGEHERFLKERLALYGVAQIPPKEYWRRLDFVLVIQHFERDHSAPDPEKRVAGACRLPRLTAIEEGQEITAEVVTVDGVIDPLWEALLNQMFTRQLRGEFRGVASLQSVSAPRRRAHYPEVCLTEAAAVAGDPAISPDGKGPPAADLAVAPGPGAVDPAAPRSAPGHRLELRGSQRPAPELQGGVEVMRSPPPADRGPPDRPEPGRAAAPADHAPPAAVAALPTPSPDPAPRPKLQIELSWREQGIDVGLHVAGPDRNPLPVVAETQPGDRRPTSIRRVSVAQAQPLPPGRYEVEVELLGVRADLCRGRSTYTVRVQLAGSAVEPRQYSPTFVDICRGESANRQRQGVARFEVR